MSIQEVIGVTSELFIWIGLGGAVLCFSILLLVRAGGGRQVSSEAVLAETPAGVHLRWLAEDGLLRGRPLADFEKEQAKDPDELRVYYRRRTPDTVELQPIDHAEGVLRLLGWILLGAGVVATVLSLVTMALG